MSESPTPAVPPPEPVPNTPVSETTTSTNKTTLWVVVGAIIVIIILGLAYWAYSRMGLGIPGVTITSYDECVQAGGQITEGIQPRCEVNGQSFVAPETPIGGGPSADIVLPPLPTLIQQCPEKLVIQMAEVFPTPLPETEGTVAPRTYLQSSQHYIIDGQQVDVAAVDVSWVNQNCTVETETIME